jgi:hypothetical protein
MEEDPVLDTLRQLLAETMHFGTRLAGNGYRGLLPDATNEPMRRAIDSLHASVAQFVRTSGLTGISPEQVLPLYPEVREVTMKGA